MLWAIAESGKLEKTKVRRNLVGARSLEGLGILGRLGLEGLLLFIYPNLILQWIIDRLKCFRGFRFLSVLDSSHMPPVASLLSRFSRLTGGSKSQSWKRLRKFFKNSRFLDFLWLCLATCLWEEASVASLLRCFHGSLRDFLVSGTSSRKKYLDKFFKFFCHKVFVDLVSSRKKRVLRFKDSF